MKYVIPPKSITLADIRRSGFVFAPSRYTSFESKEKRFTNLEKLIELRTDRIRIQKESIYTYIEIGDIDTNTGTVAGRRVHGVYVPQESPMRIEENDILISTVRTYRKGVGLVTSSDPNLVGSPALLIISGVKGGISKFYLLAFLRSDFFVEQILAFQKRGMYPRLDRDNAKEVNIPLPSSDLEMQYVSCLQQALLQREEMIKQKNDLILTKIKDEILRAQKDAKFTYESPRFKSLNFSNRLDAGYYSYEYKKKEFALKNYRHGSSSVKDWGFEIERGQNLQESNIGKSIYSPTRRNNFYTLIRPTNFSEYGTVSKFEYLGNSNKLSVLLPGDIVFSAEGTIGKCILFANPKEDWVTNIHGIVLRKDNHNLSESAFVACMLRFQRKWKIFDYLSVGGQGGSMAMQYWDDILIPNFPSGKQKEIASYYFNEAVLDIKDSRDVSTFQSKDADYIKEAGIIQLDETAKIIGERLATVVDQIINGKAVQVDFSFLSM